MVKNDNNKKLNKIGPIKSQKKEISNTKLTLSSSIFKKGMKVSKLVERLNKWNLN